jgi:hypothetical protein
MGEAVRRGAISPVVMDALLGTCVAVGFLAAAVAGIDPSAVASPRSVDAGAVALAVAVAVAVAVRHRHPVAALVVLNAVTIVWFLAAYPGRSITLVPLISCYTLSADRGWRWGLAGAVPTALVQILAIRVVAGDVETVAVVPLAVLLVATAGSAGASAITGRCSPPPAPSSPGRPRPARSGRAGSRSRNGCASPANCTTSSGTPWRPSASRPE